MSQAIEEQLRRIVRDDLLLGSDRELPLDVALGDLGLDSLALVTFLTNVEAEFGVALPDDAWVARGPLTLGGMVNLVRVAQGERRTRRVERVKHALSRLGVVGRALRWTLVRARRLQWNVFYADRHVILERRLDADLPVPEPPPGVELRPYEVGDDLTGLWPPFDEKRGRRQLSEAVADGAVVLAAVESGRVIALDLLSAEGEEGVVVSGGRDACYGYRLVVAPGERGRGIASALLAYSLDVALQRGFRAQLAFVNQDNLEMLATATHVLGFRQIGTARRTRIAGRTRWSWDIAGRRGAGPALVL